MRYCRTHNVDYFADCPGCAVQTALRQKRYETDQTPISYGAPTLWQKLASLQSRIHSVREDYRERFCGNGFDARLNSIEAEIEECIAMARGDNQRVKRLKETEARGSSREVPAT